MHNFFKRRSELTKLDLLNRVIFAFVEDEMGTFTRGEDVLTQIEAVNLLPDGTGGGNGLFC
jgi:hypothetical protein